MKNKRAFLVSKETVELILVVAFIALIIFLLYNLLIGGWNKEEQTAKSYLETLKKEIEKTDKGGIGEFEIWQSERDYQAFYFGDKKEAVSSGIGTTLSFRPQKSAKNNLCICYYENSESGKTKCPNCFSLNHPAVFPEQVRLENSWIEGAGIWRIRSKKEDSGGRVKITKSQTDDKYVFAYIIAGEKKDYPTLNIRFSDGHESNYKFIDGKWLNSDILMSNEEVISLDLGLNKIIEKVIGSASTDRVFIICPNADVTQNPNILYESPSKEASIEIIKQKMKEKIC